MGSIGEAHTPEEQAEIEKGFDELMDNSARRLNYEEVKLIRKAFVMANTAHQGQRRKTTREPYIHHPIAVAKIVAELGLGPKTIAAALLHDVVEDCKDYTIDTIKESFGNDIAVMVDGLTNIPESKTENGQDSEANEERLESVQMLTFRHLLETIPTNIRIVYIKIADRLHNLQTMEGMPVRTQQVKASEALQVYVPFAKRLGLYTVKNQLEDLSFQYINPDVFTPLKDEIKASEPTRHEELDLLRASITTILVREKFEFEIKYRERSIFSAYKLMQSKDITFSELEEFSAIRVVFEPNGYQSERMQAWGIYSAITEDLQSHSQQLKDYTHAYMLNGYRALHFSILSKKQNWIQIQVLSKRWELISEKGFIIDRQYTEDNIQNSQLGEWVNMLRDDMGTVKNVHDFFKNIQNNFYITPIQCFTPKRRLVNLPEGATVLDFAFQVHSGLGLECQGAIVNFKQVGRDYVLQNSDRVEVTRNQNQRPDKTWLDMVKTTRATEVLKSYFRKEDQRTIQEGKNLYLEMLELLNVEVTTVFHQRMVSGLKCINLDDLYLKLGAKRITISELQREIKRLNKKNWMPKILSFNQGSTATIDFDPKKPFLINGALEISEYILADCCNPIAGDRAFAFKPKSGPIIIHRNLCTVVQHISASSSKQITSVEWSPTMMRTFVTKISLKGHDRDNLVAEVLGTIRSFADSKLVAVHIDSDAGVFEGSLKLWVQNSTTLKAIIAQIQQIEGIKEVNRLEKIL
ncbi:MAG: hypothetical protein RIS47_1325 [Bacteroidota bacterium]